MLGSTESHARRSPGSGSKASIVFRILAFLIAAISTSSACSQEELLKDLFPGVKLSRHLSNSGTDLFVGPYARIKSSGKEYVALTYYEPYPDAPSLRYVSHALLELAGTGYKLVLDHVAADGAGSDMDFPVPFLYTVDAQGLVVFPACLRGCEYSFFRLDAKPTQVTLQGFDGLSVGESLSRRGVIYRFETGGLSATFNVARTGDASCCPSGGTVQISYKLHGNQFQISRVERNESAQMSQ